MKHYLDQMPLYVAGQLLPDEISALENHLRGCSVCREELKFWRALAGEVNAASSKIAAPPDLAVYALNRIQNEPISGPPFRQTGASTALAHTLSLLHAQAYLPRREMWQTNAAVMALGVIVALISNHVEAVSFIAPMAAAASLAMLHGPAYDPAYELVLATPTPAWKILLARLSVVSAYNLLLALLASVAMLLIIPPGLLGMITIGWLAPMAFLSALALLLSIWIGAGNAISLAYGLWLLQFLQISAFFKSWEYSSHWEAFINAYQSFWQSSGLLLALALVLLGVALLSTRFTERGLPQKTF